MGSLRRSGRSSHVPQRVDLRGGSHRLRPSKNERLALISERREDRALTMRSVTRRAAWYAAVATAGVLIILSVVLAVFDPSVHRYVLRLYDDPSFLRDILLRFGVLGPVVFIVIQALQVIIAPIPGEITGLLGGFVFGQWLGFVYSTLGLTVGSLFAFGIGRWLGETFVRRAVSETLWRKLGFILAAAGTLLCFITSLSPGLPQAIRCSLSVLIPCP